ncbi:Uncharacterised protein [Achromobacter spanius]|uniref:DUF7259 domain-containing protein n=1 Tax=Achromobacter spanius TaxID=217203 RepID=UPI000C2CA2DC|nr:hypothetical protein [Achromobacter spanius]AUA55180.1 hypothetical protein CVS48_03510 [Achromobacter spanius]CAB3703056.1 hypothetical protein LMG5911_05097 [Achromobacter spanius]SPT41289.1 Uncharacterised protein [Achromobacter denitrificans]VEE57375.1 Uncharacterised protein [Achromobacter spanius]
MPIRSAATFSCAAPLLADAIADLAWCAMTGKPASYRALTPHAATPITLATHDRVRVNALGRLLAIEQADPAWPLYPGRANVVYLGSELWQDGRLFGHTVSELIADLADGQVTGVPDPARFLIFMKE